MTHGIDSSLLDFHFLYLRMSTTVTIPTTIMTDIMMTAIRSQSIPGMVDELDVVVVVAVVVDDVSVVE